MIAVVVGLQALGRPGVVMVGVMAAVMRGAKVAVPEQKRPHQVPELQLERREVLRVGPPTVSACVVQHQLPMPSRASEG